MEYDDIYQYTGHMGRFQWVVFAVMCGISIFNMEAINMVFVGGPMDHWCRIDALTSLPPERQKYLGVPPANDGPGYSDCEMYDVNWTALYDDDQLASLNVTGSDVMGANSTRTVDCSEWNYDRSKFESTIVSRFDLVCGQEYLVELVTSVYMFGILAGTLLSGVISDRFGRKPAMILAVIIKSIGTTIALFASDYVTFVVGRFICGIGMAACFLTAFVMVMEMVGPRFRTVVGIVVQMALSVSFMMNAFVAIFVRDDFYLQLITMGPLVLFLPISFVLPESPRWLVVHSKFDDAHRLLRRICKVNGTELPSDLDLRDIHQEKSVEEKGCTDLVRTDAMRRRTLVMYFSWFTCALIYCALSMFSTHLAVSSSIHLNTLISGAIEIPVNVLTIFLVDWQPMGRRGTGCIALIGAGLTSLLGALMTYFAYDLFAMILSLVAKSFITMAYTVAYLFGSEVFPTEVRNVGVGIGSMLESAGAILAPFIGGPLARMWTPLPSIIYGICASLSGASYVLLPETLGQPLPNTIEEIDVQAAVRRKWGCLNSVLEVKSRSSTGSSAPSDEEQVTLKNDSMIGNGVHSCSGDKDDNSLDFRSTSF